MCGIAGYVASRGAPNGDPSRVGRAVAALHHRGPDGEGVKEVGAAILGHTRLSIIDPANGEQPMENEDGQVLAVYNGEIWNYRDLRSQLERAGHRFRTGADTEVIVHGYEEWGEGLLDRIDGMYAFAIWSAREERLLLARDRIGKKPLFIGCDEHGLAFGSDARSVLFSAGRSPELATEHVAEFLFQRYVGAPRTLLRGVRKLEPGQLARYDREALRLENYWRLQPSDDRPLEAAELRSLLRGAVERRLMSDVPLGVLLSGGIDSAAVLGLIDEVGGGPVSTFTIGFDDPLFDERPWARASAERFGADHHDIGVSAEDFVTALPRLAWARDEPIAEPSEVPLLLVAELAGRSVKVVLTGDGGDELFGGYPKYRAERLLGRGGEGMRMLMRAGGRALALRPSHRRLGRAVETLSIGDPVLRWASWFRSFSVEELDRLLEADLRPRAGKLEQPLRAHLQPYGNLDPVQQMMVGDFLTWLPDNMLMRGDKVLMAASVEGRTPLLDRRIVERVSSAPARDRLGLGSPKALLREALRDLVPEEVFDRPKRGFTVPVARFMAEDKTQLLQSLVGSDRCLERGLFAPDELRSWIDRESNAGGSGGLKLFTLASLELWMRMNVDQMSDSVPADVEGFREGAAVL